jgi:hypothetical protein
VDKFIVKKLIELRPSNKMKITGSKLMGGYRAAFLRQVKNRVLTLKRAKRYEKVKIYRSTDSEGA